MTHPAPELRLVESPPEPVDPLIGITLDGRYTITHVLGKGGMGLVYAAKHAILGKNLAIKVLKPEVSRDEQVMMRFRREAQSASAIGSPHICDVSDFGNLPDGATYFVMEFLDGPSLSGALEAQRPMSVERILSVGIQLCDALGAAHERGIVHRDLKPDNVHLVNQGKRDDFVKVLDFGIAKVGGAADKKLTQAGQVFGTPHYMSPEQCSGRDVDHRTDIYALGVMLYEMATGQVPFDADNLMGVLTKHVYEQPIPPREFPPPVDVPPGLESVILKCLTKQAEDRYQSMQELREDLQKVSRGATPDAVVRAMDRASVPRTQMMGASSPALEVTPGHFQGSTASVHEEPPKSRLGLVIGALFGMLVLGAGVFAAAFFLGGREEAVAVTPPVDDPAPVVDPPVQDPPPVAVEPTPPPVVAPAVVHLATDPAGAEVYSGDGALIGNTPLDLPRPEGRETTRLSIRLAGHQTREFTVSSLTSETVTVRLDRERVAAPRRGRRPAPVIAAPTPQPLAPAPPVRRPPPRSSGGIGSEIISPW